MNVKAVLKRINKVHYVILHELIDGNPFGCDDCILKSAYSLRGVYIGSSQTADHLHKKYGIVTFLPHTSGGKVASVGWSYTNKKWYGWSHRAIASFKTKKEAIKFARSVS